MKKIIEIYIENEEYRMFERTGDSVELEDTIADAMSIAGLHGYVKCTITDNTTGFIPLTSERKA